MAGSNGGGRFEILSRTSDLIQRQGWQGLGETLIRTIGVAIILGAVDLLNAALSVPIQILEALGAVVADLNIAIFGGVAEFIGSTLGSAAASFGTGWTALLGVFPGPLGVAVGLLMVWEILYFLDVTDSDVIGVVVDIPDFILNSDDSGTADEEADSNA